MGRAHEVRKASMEKTAKAKAKLYSKFGKEIYLVAKAGGPEPDGNLALRSLIDKAKRAQVPSDVIKRAIDKVKSGATENYETLKFEGFGPGDSTIIVECLTDNVNRTLSQVRPAFTKSKAKLGAAGSVSYLYDTISVVVFEGLDEEETLEALMNGDVEVKDMETLEDGSVKVIGEPTDLTKIKDALTQAKADIQFTQDDITTIPQEYTELDDEQMELFERLMNLLSDCDDVDTVYHNVSNYDDGQED